METQSYIHVSVLARNEMAILLTAGSNDWRLAQKAACTAHLRSRILDLDQNQIIGLNTIHFFCIHLLHQKEKLLWMAEAENAM